jgi:hypothetical protein
MSLADFFFIVFVFFEQQQPQQPDVAWFSLRVWVS